MSDHDTDQAHDDQVERDRMHMAAQRANWYAWEKERNRKRRLEALGKGCAFFFLIIACVLIWIGIKTLAEGMGWL